MIKGRQQTCLSLSVWRYTCNCLCPGRPQESPSLPHAHESDLDSQSHRSCPLPPGFQAKTLTALQWNETGCNGNGTLSRHLREQKASLPKACQKKNIQTTNPGLQLPYSSVPLDNGTSRLSGNNWASFIMIRTQTLPKINPQIRGSFKDNKNNERRNPMEILCPACLANLKFTSHTHTNSYYVNVCII